MIRPAFFSPFITKTINSFGHNGHGGGGRKGCLWTEREGDHSPPLSSGHQGSNGCGGGRGGGDAGG